MPETDEKSDRLSFAIEKGSHGARLGLLRRRADRPAMPTPCFIATTSRGVVPHLTPDTVSRHISLHGVYMAVEDFVEKAPQRTPPILSPALKSGETSGSSLRRFTSMPDHQLLILGARRTPPVPAPMTNTAETMAICTSVGFQQMDAAFYQSCSAQLNPDVVVALADVHFPLSTPAGTRRREKMSGRTERWVQEHLDALDGEGPALFAPILPIEPAGQAWYLESLASNAASLSGLAIYEPSSMPSLPSQLLHLPRLSLAEPSSPHAVLQSVALGADMVTAPFVCQATDMGIALCFYFSSAQTGSESKLPIGVDCSTPGFAADLGPLVPSCPCYTCATHHRAYVHHLLAAGEMLAWTLLAVHNFTVIDSFFAAIRQSIADDSFGQAVIDFAAAYEPELPATTSNNSGVRLRGYQQSSAQSKGKGARLHREGPLNPAAWKEL